MGKLTGKTILITGGANGVGASTTELFCREGGHVVFVDRDGANGRALETRLLAQGLNARFIEADIPKCRKPHGPWLKLSKFSVQLMCCSTMPALSS
jgi:NAD(P)-dependent dehydrogenase (short-subunit alcohol dehydrogenase family)